MNYIQCFLLLLQFLFFFNSGDMFSFQILDFLLNFLRAWDFGNTEILKLFF